MQRRLRSNLAVVIKLQTMCVHENGDRQVLQSMASGYHYAAGDSHQGHPEQYAGHQAQMPTAASHSMNVVVLPLFFVVRIVQH